MSQQTTTTVPEAAHTFTILQPSPYEPTNIAEARSLAQSFAASRLTKCRTPEQALMIMATGRELGIPATAALRMIYVADFGMGDQITLSADLMVALCLRDTERCEYFRCVESTDEIATYETKRRGDPPVRRSFTRADKERAKLGLVKEGKDAGASNWAKYPATMLRHRAASLLAREVYPDILGGFYTPDEAQEAAIDNPAARFAGLETDDVQPLRPAAAPPAQAAAVETLDEKIARWEIELLNATSDGDTKRTRDEIKAALPDAKDPARARLTALYAERKAAKFAPPPAPAPKATDPSEFVAACALVASREALAGFRDQARAEFGTPLPDAVEQALTLAAERLGE